MAVYFSVCVFFHLPPSYLFEKQFILNGLRSKSELLCFVFSDKGSRDANVKHERRICENYTKYHERYVSHYLEGWVW